ncbi:UNVERIFIED_CONTAM: hypothetical protein PYX00_008227 [Menopon gallinae]|uniref:Nucleolar protein 11 n=1 Tax=Menopon gallinae TaxID=328185 RepID=A0AAW2HMD0_9NEOP
MAVLLLLLGKNMVISCRTSDQKQLNSWSTRISKLTSKVVYDSINENYVGVFDNIHIKQWTKSDASIEKLKKRTMKNEIHDILLYKKTSFSKPSLFLLFKNGACMELEAALKYKGDITGILKPEEEIIHTGKIISQEEKFLIIVAQFQNKYLCYSVQLEEDNYSVIPDTVKKVKLRRQGASMLGYCILQEDKRNSLLTYWSDGFLCSLPVPLVDDKNGVGKFLGRIHTVSSKFDVAMVPVSYTQIAFYASDLSEEGAILGVYNVKFGLFQVQTSFKLFNKPPRIWVVENNIVILMGQRLVCVPFTLQAEMLSALACSRALHSKPPSLSQEISAVIPTMSWEDTGRKTSDADGIDNDNINCPENIKEMLSACSSEGWSEYGICQFILDKLSKNKDYYGLCWCLQTFTDIPDDLIVKLLVLILNDKNSDVWAIDKETSTQENLRTRLLNKLLGLPMNDVNLLVSLRLYFEFEDCLALLDHLCGMSADSESESNVFTWTIVLLDAFYQQFILSRDSKVLEIMVKLRKRIENEIETMESLKTLLALLMSLRKGKLIVNNQFPNTSYTVEKLRLYK